MGQFSAIDDFLAQRRLALVGASRDPADFSRVVLRELLSRGYDVVPVNPEGAEIEGRPCARRVSEIAPPVDAVLVMTPAAVSADVVRDCATAGVARVWLHRGAGIGAVSAAAVALCYEHGIRVVPGACPLMFLPGTGWFHGLHGLVLRLFGRHPRQSLALR